MRGASYLAFALCLLFSGEPGWADDGALGSKEKAELEERWQALMQSAWSKQIAGEPTRSVPDANGALEVAIRLQDEWRIGRSLCWLGWSFASMGRYELALQFYDRAIEIGSPGGKITHVAVWGLATQEKGWLLARIGRLESARALLEETTAYARAQGILVGVAEGAAHLAEIALIEGKVKTAQALADEALRAARAAACNPSNTARAMVTVGKAVLAGAGPNPDLRRDAESKAREALHFAEDVNDKRHVAEAKLLLARALPSDAHAERIALATSAFEILDATESEIRGWAEAELGRVLGEAAYPELAAFYLRAGLQVSEALFRDVDSAFIAAHLADVHALQGKVEEELLGRQEAAALALESGALPLAVENLDILSAELFRRRYFTVALDFATQALHAVDRRIAESVDAADRKQWLEKKAALSERRVEILLALGLSPDSAY